MNEININKLNSRIEALEHLCSNLHSDFFKLKLEAKNNLKRQTKKVKELCIGDKVFFFFPCEGYEADEIITKLQEYSPTQIRIITEQGTEAIFKKDKVVSLTDPKTEKVEELVD